MKILINIFAIMFALNASANDTDIFKHYPSSSIPEDISRLMVDMPITKTQSYEISVLIFPHTLKNDWRHGGPDNKKTFKIISKNKISLHDSENKELSGRSFEVIHFDEKYVNVRTLTEVLKLKLPIELKTSGEILIERLGNENKSHEYTGHFKIVATNDSLKLVNTIDIETYLRGVVPSESLSTWPIAALKAQTLAARSYAIYHLVTRKKILYDVDDTARYQVYSGTSDTTEPTDRAIRETAGEVITYNKKVIVAFFHSFSGGYTDSAKNIFKSKKAPYCDKSKEVFSNQELLDVLPVRNHWIVEWKKSWNKQVLLEKLKLHKDTKELFSNFDNNNEYNFNILAINDGFESIKTLEFNQNGNKASIDHIKLRATLGWSKFNSYHYNITEESNTEVEFTGKGWGHHVGLSQWGAMMMAKYYNYNYQDIIKHYYHNVEIKKAL